MSSGSEFICGVLSCIEFHPKLIESDKMSIASGLMSIDGRLMFMCTRPMSICSGLKPMIDALKPSALSAYQMLFDGNCCFFLTNNYIYRL